MFHKEYYIPMRYRWPVIDGVKEQNIDARLREDLLNQFEGEMKSIAGSSLHSEKYLFNDTAYVDYDNMTGFRLTMKRVLPESREHWFGVFTRGKQRMEIQGHLERR